MRQMLRSLLSRERREAVMPYVTTARVGENAITVEAPEKMPMTVPPPLAGELLAHEWSSRAPRRPRAKSLKSIRRTRPPMVVILSGEETPTSGTVAHRIAEAFVRQGMVSSYATQSIVMDLKDNPRWLQDEQHYNPHALRRLEQLVVKGVSEGDLQSHAVLVFDDVKPMPIEETVNVVLALACMSQETQRHPALQGHRNNLFTKDFSSLF